MVEMSSFRLMLKSRFFRYLHDCDHVSHLAVCPRYFPLIPAQAIIDALTGTNASTIADATTFANFRQYFNL